MKKFLTIVFKFLQKAKINVIPNHYYSNIPDFVSLSNEDFWEKPMSMIGIRGIEIQPQLKFVKTCVDSVKEKSIFLNQDIHKQAIAEENADGYGVIEADLLYSFISFIKPKKVVQIGCGVSTAIILRAGREINHSIKLVCIEPYPSEYLKKLHEEGTIELIYQKAQMVAVKDLVDLEAGDLLFVDSTHTVKVGSEVNKIILEALPRLKKGVFIHFHDIYFPFDYQRNINSTVFFWSESSLLHSFLINNDRFTIRMSQSMLHYKAKELLEDILPNYNPQTENYGIPHNRSKDYHFPSSTYLEVV